MAEIGRLVFAGGGRAVRLAEALGRRLGSAARTLLHWQELAHQRRALALMDDRMLKDIGLTRAEARRLAARIPRNEVRRWLGARSD